MVNNLKLMIYWFIINKNCFQVKEGIVAVRENSWTGGLQARTFLIHMSCAWPISSGT